MVEYIILGIAQGIAEWLPISSEGVIVLIKTNIFGSTSLSESIHTALFLHLGTFFAAFLYFKSEIIELVRSLMHSIHGMVRHRSLTKNESSSTRLTLVRYLLITTVISGLVGFFLLSSIESYEEILLASSKAITVGVGILLLITGFLQKSVQKIGLRSDDNLTNVDALVLGLVQACAALPGLSRSGLTISALLLRGINEQSALKISFLMSLPIVLFGNILLNISGFIVTTESLIGLLTAFIVGLATIHGLMKFAQTIHFGTFVIVFGIITIVSTFI